MLREGRVGEIDAGAIAEEIDDVGEEQYNRLESALRLLMHHLLKWDYQPAARSRSWAIAIREQRRRADRQLRRNPGLKSASTRRWATPTKMRAMSGAGDRPAHSDLPFRAALHNFGFDGKTDLVAGQ